MRQNYEKEICSALLNKSREKVTLFKMLTKNHFSNEQLGDLFQAMKELFELNEPIDALTTATYIEKNINEFRSFYDKDILILLLQITDYAILSGNEVFYAKEVEKHFIKRKMKEAALRIQAISDSEDDMMELKNKAIKFVSDIGLSDEGGIGQRIDHIFGDCIDTIERQRCDTGENPDKLYYGFYGLDKITGGLRPKELTIVGARPAVGKTQFAIAAAKNLAERGNKVIMFSREMGEEQLGTRFLANYTGIGGYRLRDGRNLTQEEVDSLKIAKEKVTKNILINTTAASIQEIRAVIRELSINGEIDVVFIDYLGLLFSGRRVGDRRQELEYITRQLKLMTLEFGLPIVTLSQLSRASVKENREPSLHDLRETGAIEQDADNVFFLHCPDWVDDLNKPFPLKIIVSKQRSGQTDNAWVINKRNEMKLIDLTEEQWQEVKYKEQSKSKYRGGVDIGGINL